MKPSRHCLFALTALALAHWGAAAQASDRPAAGGLQEIPDAELATMRGRYTIGDNAVAWFGVQMISTWQNTAGQVLQSSLAMNVDFTHGGAAPQVSFRPSVTITRPDAPAAPSPPIAGPSRSVDGSGLTNVRGVTQSVQVAGDSNLANNVTQLTVQDGSSAPTGDGGTMDTRTASNPTPAGADNATNSQTAGNTASPAAGNDGNTIFGSGGASGAPPITANATAPSAQNSKGSTSVPNAGTSTVAAAAYGDGTSAVASVDGHGADVQLTIDGQGMVKQWIRNGSIGQSVQLAADNQWVSNRMEINLIRQTIAANTQLSQNVAQAISLARGIGVH